MPSKPLTTLSLLNLSFNELARKIRQANLLGHGDVIRSRKKITLPFTIATNPPQKLKARIDAKADRVLGERGK